jgi:maltooligosyltrehalose trehalohydrolase
MGEEWGSKVPFPFFCDFKGGLAEAVRKGRRDEYAWAYEKFGGDVPDPLSEATFRSAILDWENLNGNGRERLALVRELLVLRQRHVTPRLAGARFGEAHAADSGLLNASWYLGDGARLSLLANLSDRTIPGQASENHGAPIWGTAGDAMTPWSVLWRLETR